MRMGGRRNERPLKLKEGNVERVTVYSNFEFTRRSHDPANQILVINTCKYLKTFVMISTFVRRPHCSKKNKYIAFYV